MDPKDDGKGKKTESGLELGNIGFGFGVTSQPVAQGRPPAPRAEQKPNLGEQSVTADLRGGAREEGQPLLPLRIMLVADLVPRAEHNAGADAPDHSIRLDPAHVEGLFQKLRPRASIEVGSVLAQGGRVRIEISPTSMKSFRPDGLCREVPLLRAMVDGRAVLERLRDGSTAVDQAAVELGRLWQGSPFARQILGYVETAGATSAAKAAAAPAPTAEPSGSVVARIMELVDTGSAPDAEPVSDEAEVAGAAPAKKNPMDELIAAVVKSARTGRPGAKPDEAIRRLERALSLQLGAVLQHPEVRRLEQAWRGVDFVASRVGSTPGIRLDVVSARPEQMAEALERAVRANAAVEPPVSFALVDDSLDGTAAALARLQAIAEVGEAHTVPIVVNGRPQLFGFDELGAIERLDNKASLYDAPARAPWRAITARPALRWVSVALNRVLARTAYDKRAARLREVELEELPAGEPAVVWLSPCWAVADLVIHSFRKTGWPCRITGAREGGRVENLPVREVAANEEGDERVAIPTEVLLSVDSQRALGRYGVLALASVPNTDEIYVLHAATAYVTPPKRTYDSETTEPEVRLPAVPLGDQLFVARIAQFLRALGSRIPPNSDPAEVKPVMEGALWALFENAPPSGPEITVEIRGARAAEAVAVTVRPRRFLGVALEELSLEVPLG